MILIAGRNRSGISNSCLTDLRSGYDWQEMSILHQMLFRARSGGHAIVIDWSLVYGRLLSITQGYSETLSRTLSFSISLSPHFPFNSELQHHMTS